ncbi:CBS domain-containing protein [Nocardiopsis alborubida]|uniref:CBS domain-containing protein n=1 Tax=Nocardiopsis alborubida TaxID=146802 RepID=A0A7X6MFI8_9ACTN|nr:CBS domain-containing protein [Nocardiopsis alborubida]NKZ00095.1 CBS domain-containing protein [Nocardiopsis alborubida]
MTIRKFPSYWNVARRTPSSEAAIQSDLEEKGLTTQPSFTEGWIDNTIDIVRAGEEPTNEEATSTPLRENEVEEPFESTSSTLRGGGLEAANRKVVSVRPQDTVRKAVTTMISRNFSQLAVIADDGLRHGVVSWESIGKMRLGGFEPTSVDQVKASVPVVEQDDLLLNQIPHIYGHGFVLVRNSDLKSVSGIITTAVPPRQGRGSGHRIRLVRARNLRVSDFRGDSRIPKDFSPGHQRRLFPQDPTRLQNYARTTPCPLTT